ncbi:MAG: ELWxxDGT repeat protein [Ilyomonas sp.]
MKKLFIGIQSIVLFSCISPMLSAQNIRLIDIEKSKDSYSNNNTYSDLNMFAELNGVFYFSSNDGIHGYELWRSDGSFKGTYLVKDINPGINSSNCSDITVFAKKIYFSASDGVHGQELWSSDGTAQGTQLVADLNPYYDANPSFLTNVNGTLYFVISSSFNYRDQLWKTDGTEAGTVLVADFSSPYSENAKELTNVNGKLFFTLDVNGYDSQVFTSDGTAQGTFSLGDFNSNGADGASNLTSLNGLLYFSVDDNERGLGHLYVSDGTVTGTHAVNNPDNIFVPLYRGEDFHPFTIKNNTLFFQGYTDDNGYELCKYNALNPSNKVAFVKDIIPGSTSSYPNLNSMINVNGTIFFTIGPAGADAELWKTDGTSAGTVLVKDINPGGLNGYYGLINMNGTLMFAFGNNALGFELWKSDGTKEGTVLVKDIMTGIYSSYPSYLTYKHGIFIFSAKDPQKGFELWKSDGTEAGTVLIKDINRVTTSPSYPGQFTALNKETTIFTAGTLKKGFELYKTNGWEAGTKIVKDIYAGSFSSYPGFLTKSNNRVYFFATDSTGYNLGSTNGLEAGTKLFYHLNLNNFSIQQITATDDLLYFTLFNYTNYQQELWRSDGTAAGTYPIKTDLSPYYNLNITAVGKTLFFVNDDFVNGPELWKTDGTVANTTIVKDIYPGYQGSYPSNLYSFKGRLYFSADYGYGPFLWVSDGTEAGTKVIKAALVQGAFAQANDKLFFNAYSTVARGNELYATDGTSAGTKLVKDINKGPAGSYPFALTNGDTALYFFADDGKHGSELWTSNGSREATHLVKNITPGIDGTYFNSMVNVNDKLFFIVNDTLWQSDGTKNGTHKVKDETLEGVNNLTDLTSVNDRLFFSGYSYQYGQELYTAKAEDCFEPKVLIAENITAVKPSEGNKAIEVKLLNNPFSNQLQFIVEVKEQEVVQMIITDNAGKILASADQKLSPGSNMFSFDTKSWAQSIYLVKITTHDGLARTLKVVKQN